MNTLRVALFVLLLGACALMVDLLVLGGYIPSTILSPSIWNLSLILGITALVALGFIVSFLFNGRIIVISSLFVSLGVISEVLFYSTFIVGLPLCFWFIGIFAGKVKP